MTKKEENRRVCSNINLLDRAVGLPSKTLNKKGEYDDGNGFTIVALNKDINLPTTFDKKILYYILFKVQQRVLTHKPTLEDPSYGVHFPSINKALKEMGLADTTQYRDAWKRAIIRWGNTELIYKKGNWYFGSGKYNTGVLHYRPVVGYEEDGSYILLHDTFVNASKDIFSRHLPLDQILKLKTPLSLRLFEVLCKSFHKAGTWEIGLEKLTSKLGCGKVFPKDMKKNIQKATDHISENTYLQVVASFKENNVVIFTKLETGEREEYYDEAEG
ncbi:MAG: replication initiation protein [Deltaproteobacteria bacterium]|nr:replication initiation protein [Deltaproteobacteria bacterium]